MKLWPLEETVFDEAAAERLAAACYRTHAPGPWVRHGKIQELLDGLWWAEVGHFKGSLIDGGVYAERTLKTKLKPKGKFGTKMLAATLEWEKLSDQDRLYFAELMKGSGEEGDANEIVARVSRLMNACLLTENRLQSVREVSRGPIPQLAGLRKFVDRMKTVWTRNDLGEEFTAEFDTRVETDRARYPVSSAAKLICASAALIDPRYTPATCETVMRPR